MARSLSERAKDWKWWGEQVLHVLMGLSVAGAALWADSALECFGLAALFGLIREGLQWPIESWPDAGVDLAAVIRPRHAGQRSASTSKTLCIRSAQAVRRDGGTPGVTNAASRARASVETGPDSINPGRRTGEAGGLTIPAPLSRRASRPSLAPSIRVVG